MSRPPYRAEHIGSLLRPARLLDLRRRQAAGEPVGDALSRAEDDAIREAVALQKRVGLELATDGEFRRAAYHSYFYAQLGDVSLEPPPEAPSPASGKVLTRGAQPQATIRSRLAWKQPIHVTDYLQLAGLTDAAPKITIPGPCALHFRGGDKAVLATAYRDTEQFWSDTIEAFGRELSALAAAGCRYVQIDETAFAKFGDPKVQETLAARGDAWSPLIDKYIAITNRILADAPKEMAIGMHLCRGNRGGQCLVTIADQQHHIGLEFANHRQRDFAAQSQRMLAAEIAVADVTDRVVGEIVFEVDLVEEARPDIKGRQERRRRRNSRGIAEGKIRRARRRD